LTDKIVFEDNSAMGANCQVWTHVGDYLSDQHDKNDYEENIAPVVVRAGAVCYSGVLLNPGIIVGKRSRVFAMSMVSSDVPENEIWAGVPAKKLMEREGKITLRK
jgi:maltose O-acetyltransferase